MTFFSRQALNRDTQQPDSSLVGWLGVADLRGRLIVFGALALLYSFVLETSSTFDGTAAWTILTNDVQINGSSFVLTTTTGSSTAFYRLRKL